MSFIPYGRQNITDEDVEAVIKVLRSDWLTQGPAVSQFEHSVSDYCGATHAVAVSNGTAALHLACLALGLGAGDWLWTSPNTFVASANCALYCGAQVDFVDICPETYNISIEALKEKLLEAEKAGCLPKVVVPVHFAGQSCDMAEIKALSDKYGFKIIEDASHAIGGTYQQTKVGSCHYSDITVFSFHPVKVMTTAEGGMCTCNDDDLAQKLNVFRTHGITRDPALMTHEPEGGWYYQQLELGYNYRISDLQCALGVSQMGRLDNYVAKRNEIAKRYDELLSGLSLQLPIRRTDRLSAFHLYVIHVLDQPRKAVFDALRSQNIGVNVHYIPVHLQPYYQKMGFQKGDFPTAEAYYSQAISLPMYPTLSIEQQAYVVNCVKEALLQEPEKRVLA